MQPVSSAAGHLLNKLLSILHEKQYDFGVRVQKDLILPSNVVVRASTSGKISDEKHRIFLEEVLWPAVHTKIPFFS